MRSRVIDVTSIVYLRNVRYVTAYKLYLGMMFELVFKRLVHGRKVYVELMVSLDTLVLGKHLCHQ